MMLPTGYGYAYKTSDHWLLNYMLHNQLSKPDQVWVTYDIDLIPATSPAAKSIKPAIPIWMDVQNGSVYPVFDVIQGTGKNGEYTYPDDAKDPYKGGACEERVDLHLRRHPARDRGPRASRGSARRPLADARRAPRD